MHWNHIQGLTNHLKVFLFIFVSTILACLFFSVMGMGDVTYLWLNKLEISPTVSFAIAIFLLLLLHLLDADKWTRQLNIIRHMTNTAVMVCFSMGCCLEAKTYPYACIQFAMLSVLFALLLGRRFFFPESSMESWNFLLSTSMSLSIVAVSVIVYFTLWVFVLEPPQSRIDTGWNRDWLNFWGGDVKLYWRHRLECQTYNISAGTNDIDCYDAAFLWWFFPVLLSFALIIFSVISCILGRIMKPTLSDNTMDVRLAKTLLVLTGVCFAMIFVSASIAGAEIEMSNTVLSAMFVLIVISIAVVGAIVGRDILFIKLQTIFKSIATPSVIEYFIAFVILASTLPASIYLIVSFIHQVHLSGTRYAVEL